MLHYPFSFVYDKISSIVAQTFLSVSLDWGFRRQTQTRMSVPLKADDICHAEILSSAETRFAILYD